MTRYVIIGAGEAGTRAALTLRDAGAEAVTLVGAEADAPYERPPLSKPDGDGVTIRPIAASLQDIDVRLGVAATSIDRAARTVVLTDATSVPYDRLLLATGAKPRRLVIDPDGRALVLRTRADAEAIYARMRPGGRALIVGAGLIGLELASTFRSRGMAVTVIEAAPRAMGRALPAAMADALVERHRAEGVEILFGVTIAAIDAGGVGLEDGRRLDADLLIAAVGVIPETGLAEAAGIDCANGILVDASLTTSDPDIFAAGDCAAVDHPLYGRFRFESWRVACDQGALAARSMLGEHVSFGGQSWFWSDQYDLGLQMIGLHDPSRIVVRRAIADDAFILFELDADGALKAASGLGPGQVVGRDIRLAEMLIERAAKPSADALADPKASLKAMLKAG